MAVVCPPPLPVRDETGALARRVSRRSPDPSSRDFQAGQVPSYDFERVVSRRAREQGHRTRTRVVAVASEQANDYM